ncbi:hypothetical protein [Streptomyces sp. 891-h]|uniref:hypothetical protein n=1 Tax=Streptomyces sp. 891-h TaxID=2720714 RepID=UPI001FAAD7DE|nr:hypothetical protein [Streptomyces sp. 891-h]UNZ21382.1 hypothetical protein HC362_34350 [Streptomyces sp. 891-h]
MTTRPRREPARTRATWSDVLPDLDFEIDEILRGDVRDVPAALAALGRRQEALAAWEALPDAALTNLLVGLAFRTCELPLPVIESEAHAFAARLHARARKERPKEVYGDWLAEGLGQPLPRPVLGVTAVVIFVAAARHDARVGPAVVCGRSQQPRPGGDEEHRALC